MADEEQDDVQEAPSAESDPEPEATPEPDATEGSDPSSDDASPEAEASDAEAPEAPETSPEAPDAAPEVPAAEKPKAKDAAPGADLEPIALEPDRPLSAEERARAEAEAEERAEAEAAEGADVVADEPLARKAVKLESDARIQATGKRKNAIARVVVRSGGGAFLINSRELAEYFPRDMHQTMARQPLVTAGYEGTVDVHVRVHGGGVGGQAGAVRHGIARALTEIDPELRGELKRRGYLTRDAREKERRKAGFKKARKKPQFSKR